MATYEDTKGNTFSTYDEALASNQQPLTSSTLAPVKQIELPTPKPTTQSDGALAFLGQTAQQGVDAYAKQLESSRGDYLSSLISAPTESGAMLQAEETYGVNTAQNDLNDVNNQILAEQVALQRRLEALDKNESGLFGGALDQEKQKVKDESLKRQADLSVIQLSKQGRFDSAKAIADRAVSALMERTYRDIEARKTIYEDYKDLFNTAEQRAYESAEAEREREANNMEYRMRAEFDQKIQQQDPLYQAKVREAQANALAAEKALNTLSLAGTINGKPQTTAQATVQGYADRMLESDKIIGKIGSQFTGAASYIGQAVPNIFKSSTRQQYEQAQRNFVNAVLRRESGAVISDEEFANAQQQYFPQPGDLPEVIAQKAANRNTVINNLYLAANKPRPAEPGSIIEDAEGKQYRVGDDGETLEPL